jgi:perosamine synthetase
VEQLRIQLFKPAIREESIDGVGEVLRSGWLGLGPRTAEFERQFAAYVGTPHCVGLNSCTSALHLALRLLDLPAGSEVITTALTFVSTNHAILYENCRPIFADIQRDTGNLSADGIAERITARTRAIMLVHYGGYPCDLDEIYALARARGIPVIEDCAHACGAEYRGRRIGSHGDIHAFSFHAVKNLPMGDGGALTVRSEEHDRRLRSLRWLGITANTFERMKPGGYRWAYEIDEVGFKYHMNDIQAAIGLGQLPFVDADNARRAEIDALYRRELAGTPGIALLRAEGDRVSSHHLFVVLAEERDRLMDRLKDEEIDAGVHYVRNDRYAMYEPADLPNTEYFWRRALSLPMHTHLTDDDVRRVAAVIRGGW